MVTRQPHDRSAPIRARATSAPLAAIWSWPGEFSAADLAANGGSPMFTPFTPGLTVIKLTMALQGSSWSTGPPVIRLFDVSDQLAVISADGDWWQSVHVYSMSPRFWVTAESDESPDSTIIGHDMSVTMWYRTSPDTGA
jgi:hypothetical protein